LPSKGNSGIDRTGLIASSKDIGIVTMPNGKYLAVAAFVSITRESGTKIDSIIAELTKAAWDPFSKLLHQRLFRL
jgi:beta-lactamase class A